MTNLLKAIMSGEVRPENAEILFWEDEKLHGDHANYPKSFYACARSLTSSPVPGHTSD